MKELTDYGLTPKDAIEYTKTIPEVNYLYQHDIGFAGYKKELTAEGFFNAEQYYNETFKQQEQ